MAVTFVLRSFNLPHENCYTAEAFSLNGSTLDALPSSQETEVRDQVSRNDTCWDPRRLDSPERNRRSSEWCLSFFFNLKQPAKPPDIVLCLNVGSFLSESRILLVRTSTVFFSSRSRSFLKTSDAFECLNSFVRSFL